jgi:hypothetical protein
LQVDIETMLDDEVTHRRSVRPEGQLSALCSALQKHKSGDLSGSLVDPGDVVAVDVPFDLPGTKPGAAGVDSHDAVQSRAVLLVRLEDPDRPRESPRTNEVATLRGSGMVVRYQRREGIVVGARPFHAVVLAGTAVDQSQPQIAMDAFLRMSEPPSHDKWEMTPKLKASYKQGASTAIKRFETAIVDRLKSVVKAPAADQSDGPEALKQLLDFATQYQEKMPRVALEEAELHESGAWRVRGEITLPESEGVFRVRPHTSLNAESGRGAPLAWMELRSITGDVEIVDGWFLVPTTCGRFGFVGLTEVVDKIVDPRRATVRLSLESRILPAESEEEDA